MSPRAQNIPILVGTSGNGPFYIDHSRWECCIFFPTCPSVYKEFGMESHFILPRARKIGSNRARIDICVKGTARRAGQGCKVFDIDILLSETRLESKVLMPFFLESLLSSFQFPL